MASKEQQIFLHHLHPYKAQQILDSQYFNEIEAKNYKRFRDDFIDPIISIEYFTQLVAQKIRTRVMRGSKIDDLDFIDKYLYIGEQNQKLEVGPIIQQTSSGEHLIVTKSGKTCSKFGQPLYPLQELNHSIIPTEKGWLAIVGRNGCVVVNSESCAIIPEPIFIAQNDSKDKLILKQMESKTNQTLRLNSSGHLALLAHGMTVLIPGKAGLSKTSIPLNISKIKMSVISETIEESQTLEEMRENVIVVQIGSSLKVIDSANDDIGEIGPLSILSEMSLHQIIDQIKRSVFIRNQNESLVSIKFANGILIGECVLSDKRKGLRVWRDANIFEAEDDDLPEEGEEDTSEPIVHLSKNSTLILIGNSNKIEILRKSSFALFHENLFLIKDEKNNLMIERISKGSEANLGSGYHLAFCGNNVHLIFVGIGKFNLVFNINN
jgi:hypothetical protein